MLEIFPWIEDINREFSKSFPSDYQEYSLDLLIKKIQKELKEISSCPLSKRTKYLYEVLGYFYTHFCLKVKWNKSSQHMQVVCVQILANLIRVGLLLSDGNIESLWLNRILAAIRVFSGPPDHLYTALLCVNVLKKKYLKTYSIILKNILCYDQNTTKEPIEYLKVILLFRRLNALVKKDPVWNAEISLAVAKVKAPASLKSWLRAHNFEMLWDVKSKMILNKLMRKSLDKAILRRLQEVIVPQMCLKKTSLNRQMSPGASDSFVIDSSKQVQYESRMILTEYNGSSEVAPSTVKKLIKKRKLNFNAVGQGNIQTTNVEKGDEMLVANAHGGNKRKKAQEKKSSLIDNIQIKSNVQESTVLEMDYSGTKTSDMKIKKKRKRKQRSVKKSAGSVQGIKTMNQTDSNDTSQPSKNNIGKIKEKYDLYDIKKDSIERKLSGEKICISNSRKLINGSDKYESLDEISLQKGSPQQAQVAEKSALLSETVNCSPSVVGKEFKNVIVVKDLLDNEDTLNLQKELKGEIVENCERKDEAVEEIDKPILESVESQHSSILPVLEASSKKSLSNYIRNVTDGDINDLSYSKNTSGLSVESMNKITEDIELKDEVIDKPILESVGVQHSSTIPVLETSFKNTSDLQIELKDETIENFDREEEVIDEPILESVGVQHSSTIPVLGTSFKNTSDLQIELKDEIIENFDREVEVIDDAFLESVGLQRRLTVPVVEASSKKCFLKDDDSNKLISVKQSKIKSVNYSIEMNKSGSSFAESNCKGIIEDCSWKNTELDPQSSNLIIVENSSKNQAETFPNDTVNYIMGKMLKHLEQADHSVKDCSFETLKHNILKSGIKITNQSLSVTNDSNLESSPLLKKASNQLLFLDLSLEKSSPSKIKNTRHHVSKVTEFSFYRDFDHDLEDMKSEDSLSGSQITDKMDVKEFSSDDCSNDSDVSEINESTQVSQLGDVCKIYNSGDLPDSFHGKNNFSDSSEQSFISRNSKEKEVENETNFQVHKIDALEKDIESISPNMDSCVKSKKYKRLSLAVNLGERCDGGNVNENNSKILDSYINSAAEFDFDDKNNNSYGPENLMLQGNQIEGLHQNRKEAIDKKSPYVVLSDCVKKPFDSKIDIPKSPLHLTDSHIEMSFSSVCERISFTKSENQVKSQDQVDSCSSDLVEHDSITEPSLGMKLRKRTNHTASIEKSAPVVEEVHVKSAPVVEETHVKSAPVVEVHVKSCDTKQVETPIKLACQTSLRNRNFSRSCKSLGKGGIESPSSKSSSVKHSSKKLKKEVNQNLGFDFSVLSLDSPKTRSCRLRESSIKNIPEEQEDSVVMESETLSNSVFLNEEKEKACQKSSGSFTAASIEVDDPQKSNNQGYNLRSRKCIILPGKLKLEKKS
ncbi:uncharacterized protein TNCT_521051 [Trichonephila clavata]|uniref:Uncharacterized protein n=1 Tax=Trichonephila clavata TaxID=2740835 RepID=A0A8X6H5E1_TRICU|nr:uncharacterized protein TNCT_521051 [Trichonephila clavata]